MKRTGETLLTLILTTTAWAQLEPKAKPFLDAYTASIESESQSHPTGDKLKTVDMTMCTLTYDLPDASVPDEKTCTRTATDFTQRRMMVDISGKFGAKMVYCNRQLHVLEPGSENPNIVAGSPSQAR